MARARQLVAESGTTGDRVEVVGSPRRRVHPPSHPGIHRRRSARPRLPRPSAPDPDRLDHPSDVGQLPDIALTATGSPTTPTRPPTSPRSSAAAAPTATATTAIRRSTARCDTPSCSNSQTRPKQSPLGDDRPPTHRQRRLGSDRDDPRGRADLRSPAQLRIQPGLGLPRRPELGPIGPRTAFRSLLLVPPARPDRAIAGNIGRAPRGASSSRGPAFIL